ncbi:hypothetical protein JL720_16393 [Aureococcus anophagefferens]|nr:hypothetical protein JL720_16393 [Aureococcus anophagefferens]
MALTRVGAQTAVYCLSDGATLPAWVKSDRARRQALKEDSALGRRIDLLQDFEFEGGTRGGEGTSKRIKFSSDGNYILATGEYPPAVKGKVHRMDLDVGKFDEDLDLGSPASCVAAPAHGGVPLVGFGCEDGACRFFDLRAARDRKPVATLDVGNDVTALAFDFEGMHVACGTHDAYVSTYDVRSSKPLVTKDHQYGLPVVDVVFHRSSRESSKKLVLSADARVVKAWDGDTGAIECNVETNARCRTWPSRPAGGGSDSGLLLCAGEQSKIMSYYVPALGRAPKWCAFLDSLTEELEETDRATYGDFDSSPASSRTSARRTSWARPSSGPTPTATSSTRSSTSASRPCRRPRRHGEYKAKKVAKAMDAKKESRIRRADAADLPAVNADLARRLLGQDDDDDDDDAAAGAVGAVGDSRRRRTPAEDAEAEEEARARGGRDAREPLGDDRFGAMFTDDRFQVDRESAEFAPPPEAVQSAPKKPAADSRAQEEEAEEVRLEVAHPS